MEQKSLLEAKGIGKRFPGVVALQDVGFALGAGSIHALLGENGAGKSTLIKVLTGVETRDEGEVWFDGAAINPKSPQEAQSLGISTVYQEVNLCPNLSVAENIYIGRAPGSKANIKWGEMNKRAKQLMQRFDLDVDVTRPLDNYSVAIQQMVAIARAVDIDAKVLILDEPTSSLSTVEVEKLFAIMRMLKDSGLGIVFVTHFLDQVYEVTDTITVLRDGRYVGTYTTSELPRVQLVGKMIGKEFKELEMVAAATAANEGSRDVLLEVQDASTNTGLHNIGLTLDRGEVVGLSGLLGSGRSEVVRMLFGIDSMSGGGMELDGKAVHIKNPLAAIRKDFAFCPENRKTEGIVGELSIRENIILALQAKRGLWHAIGRKEAQQLADKYIAELSIKTPSADQLVKNLSGGNQQKVILARWLATNPQLLMLDEPTRGIDIGTKAEIQKIVVRLAGEGMSLVFISSELDEMLRCCERIVVLRDGRRVGELEGEAISESAIMNYIAGGEGA